MPLAERVEIIEGFGVVDMVVESTDADLTVCKTLEWLSKKENVKIFANGGDRELGARLSPKTAAQSSHARSAPASRLLAMGRTKPRGSYKTFEKDKGFLVKRITIAPGELLSLQSHKHRSEHWLVASGVATVECDGEKSYLNQFESISIPQGAKHRLSNESKEFLQVIEVQFGERLSETDITRYEDKYKRE